MAEPEEDPAEAPAPRSKLPLILGLTLAILGGAGGFYAAYSGWISGFQSNVAADASDHQKAPKEIGTMPDVAYVAIEPLVVSLGENGQDGHLRFRAQLEVVPAHEAEVVTLMPRVIDVLNSYLRALETRDLTDSTALVRLRAQMLRRIQIVTGGARVNDLLIMEFIVN